MWCRVQTPSREMRDTRESSLSQDPSRKNNRAGFSAAKKWSVAGEGEIGSAAVNPRARFAPDRFDLPNKGLRK